MDPNVLGITQEDLTLDRYPNRPISSSTAYEDRPAPVA